MWHIISRRFDVHAAVIAFSLFISPTNLLAQRHELNLSNGERASLDISKAGVYSVQVKDGKIQSMRKDDPEKEVQLIVTFKDLPLTAYQSKKSSLQKTSLASIYASLQKSHATFKTALDAVRRQLFSRLKSDYPYTISRDYYRSLNGIAIKCKRGMIDGIRAIPMVKHISLDREVRADLTQSVHQIRADIVQDSLGYKGKGVLVGDVDTGIDYENPALGGGFGPSYRVIGGYDFANNDNDPMDDHGHGTHVAGIIGANGGDSLRGVAPEVKFLAVKVLDAGGIGLISDVIAGIDFCLDPDGNPATDDAVNIINMSLGGQPSTDDPLEYAVDNATGAGVLSVVAAGNSGYNRYGTVGSPGTSQSALTVGACDSNNRMAIFSSLGPDPIHSAFKPEVVAPGVDILSTILNNQTASWSGTSMATPHVTGVAALLKEEHPSWTPEEIKAAIINTAHSVVDSASVFAQGRGCVDALDAAHVRMVVEPGVLSYGYVDLAQPVWTDTLQLKVKNFRSVSQTTGVSNIDGLPNGAGLTFDKTSFILGPGEETSIQAVLTVPSTVPVLATEPFAYIGKIRVASDSDNVIVPFSFIKSTTLVITFDLPPSMLWLVDRDGGTIKEVKMQEGASKYIVPVSQGYSLDLLANLPQDTLGMRNWYLVHQRIENPSGLSYVLVSHDQATMNMADDTVYDIHNNRIVLDSTAFVDISFQVIVYDTRSGQHKNMSSYEYGLSFYANLWRVFFPPLDSLFYVKKSIDITQDSSLYLLRKSVFGIQNRQDIAIATGPDNLCGLYVTSLYDDPFLAQPSHYKKALILWLKTLRTVSGGWEDGGSGMSVPFTNGNVYFNKPDENQAVNDNHFYSYMHIGTWQWPIVVDSTFEYPSSLHTPSFTVNKGLEAIFEQTRITPPPSQSLLPPEISSAYIYEILKSGDTIRIEQDAHLAFPDYVTYTGGGSMFMRCNNDWYKYFSRYGGTKQTNGVIEERDKIGSYWNMPTFTTNVFAHNRVLRNTKPFIPGKGQTYPSIDIALAYYKFDDMNNNAGAVRVLSDANPYTILGQAGQCTADYEYLVPKEATIFPSFNLLQISVDGKAMDMVRPDQTGILRLVLFDQNSSVSSVRLSLMPASGDELELPVSDYGGNEYRASIPSNLPAGFYDIIARIKDSKGNKCELIASPGFYFGSTTDSLRLDARLRMTSYTLNNVEAVTMQPGDTLKYTLTYVNYGNGIARNVVITFPTTPYFSPVGSPTWTRDSLGANDTIQIPVNLVFLGKRQPADSQANYSPFIAWNSGGTEYMRSHKVFVDFQNTVTDVVQTNSTLPTRFELYQNYPNPFNPATVISYQLPVSSKVSIGVYDILGRKVATLVDGVKNAGSYRVSWNASHVSSGVYFCRLQAGNVLIIKKMMVLK